MRRLALAASLLLAPAAARADTVAITAAHMIDVAAGTRVDDPVVVAVDGRITAVGRRGAVAIPAGARRIVVVRAVRDAPDPEAAARGLREALPD